MLEHTIACNPVVNIRSTVAEAAAAAAAVLWTVVARMIQVLRWNK
jgi:hypothetical protein